MYSSGKPNTFDFPTKRDRVAFGEVVLRSELSYAKGHLVRVEFVKDPVQTDCQQCRCGHANVRLVFNYGGDPRSPHDHARPPKFGSDTYCLHCFKQAVTDWIEETLEEFTRQYREYHA